MSTATLAIALFAIAAVMYAAAPRQARRLIDETDPATRDAADPDRLHHEMVVRLRASSIGAAAGTFGGLLTMLTGLVTGGTDGPGSILDLAILITPAVVASAAAEAVTVARRSPSPEAQDPDAPRTASLSHRTSGSTQEHAAEIALIVLAAGSFGLAVASLTAEVDGAAGAIAAAVGALVVMATCLITRTALTRRAVVAHSSSDLAVDAAAGAATAGRASENLVANGGMLALVALLIPVVGSPGSLRAIGLVLALAIVLAAVAATVTRRQRPAVSA